MKQKGTDTSEFDPSQAMVKDSGKLKKEEKAFLGLRYDKSQAGTSVLAEADFWTLLAEHGRTLRKEPQSLPHR